MLSIQHSVCPFTLLPGDAYAMYYVLLELKDVGLEHNLAPCNSI